MINENADPVTGQLMAEPQAEPAPIDRDALALEFAERLERADAILTQAREAERAQKDVVRRCGIKVEEALTNWQLQFPRRTLRDELEAQKQVDAENKLRGYKRPETAIGPSILDHTLAAGRGGSIENGRGVRPRGGTGKQFRGQVVAPKLPSQR